MTRVLIHAGFHKTATTAVQRALSRSRGVLSPLLKVAAFKPLTETRRAARRYSETKNPLDLATFTALWQNDLERIFSDLDGRKLIISSEELSGHLPGRPKVADYAAAPILAGEMHASLLAFERTEDICFYYSTRKLDGWVRSAYNEHVKASALMTLDWAPFAEEFSSAFNIEPIIEKIRTTIGPSRVETRAINDLIVAPLGVMQPILDILNVPASIQSQLSPPEINNSSLPDDILAQLLAINRLGGDHTQMKKRKVAIIKDYREQFG